MKLIKCAILHLLVTTLAESLPNHNLNDFPPKTCYNCDLIHSIPSALTNLGRAHIEYSSSDCLSVENSLCVACKEGFTLINYQCVGISSEGNLAEEENNNNQIINRLRNLRRKTTRPHYSSSRSNSNTNADTTAIIIIFTIVGLVVFGLLIFIVIMKKRNKAKAQSKAKLEFEKSKENLNQVQAHLEKKPEVPIIEPTFQPIQEILISSMPYEKPDSVEVKDILKDFYSVAPIIEIDSNGLINGEHLCFICNSDFQKEIEHRILPCMHAFHSECITKLVLEQSCNNCPIDSAIIRQ